MTIGHSPNTDIFPHQNCYANLSVGLGAPNNTFRIISPYDTGGILGGLLNTTTGVITIVTAGTYTIFGQVLINFTVANSSLISQYIRVYTPATTTITSVTAYILQKQSSTQSTSVMLQGSPSLSFTYTCLAGQKFCMFAQCTNATGVDWNVEQYNTWFGCNRLY